MKYKIRPGYFIKEKTREGDEVLVGKEGETVDLTPEVARDNAHKLEIGPDEHAEIIRAAAGLEAENPKPAKPAKGEK